MHNLVLLAAGAALLGSMAVPPAAEAQGYRHHGGYGYRGYARPYGYGYGYRRHRGNAGAAVAAGVAGALVGGAIASQQQRYYGYPAYGPPTYYYEE